MCGRYVSPDTPAIERAFHVGRTNSNPFPRRFNVAPTMQVPIIRLGADGKPELAEARWSFVPRWWKQKKPPAHCFNARMEDAADKSMWRYSYANARCLVPAEGWYEWRAVQGTEPITGEIKMVRQPYFIFRPDRGLICFAGLMSYPSPDAAGLTCAVITRSAAPSVADVHHRMPAVLSEQLFADWLSPAITKTEQITSLLSRVDINFEHYPVTPRLNGARTDEESFVLPIQ